MISVLPSAWMSAVEALVLGNANSRHSKRNAATPYISFVAINHSSSIRLMKPQKPATIPQLTVL